MSVPTTHGSLESQIGDLYMANVVKQELKRYEALIAKFEKEYGEKPTHIARAPGRVNVIGEHIDYCGFPVLPASIAEDILIAFRLVDTSVVTITNVDDTQFGKESFSLQQKAPLDQRLWAVYVNAVSETLPVHPTRGANLTIDGSIPIASGLSSSSALSVSSTLVLLSTEGQALQKMETAKIAMKSENLCGVESGGMDQMASVYAQKGHLVYVTFVPSLGVELVPVGHLFDKYTLVIAHTLVVSNKRETGKFRYNLRVVETKVAALVLAKELGLTVPDKGHWQLKDLVDAYGEKVHASFEESLEALEANVNEKLAKGFDAYTWDKLQEMLGMSASEMHVHIIGDNEVEAPGGQFTLWRRARHAFSEALRVSRSKQTLIAGGTEAAGDLATLMNASQDSCRDDYECSAPEIESIVHLSRGAGALATRLTGAGWGGATVSLVPVDKVASVRDTLRHKFAGYVDLSEARFAQSVFETRPSTGAALLCL